MRRGPLPTDSGRFLMRLPPHTTDLSFYCGLPSTLTTPSPLMTSEQMEFDGSLMIQCRTGGIHTYLYL